MKQNKQSFPRRRRAFFTIVELIVAMSIFAILMLILMQIFSATQDVWRRTSQKSDASEMARTALDLLTTDLQSAIYINDFDGPSFYYDQSSALDGRKLWFATTKSSLENNQRSKNVEVEYVLTKMTPKKDDVDLYQLEYYVVLDTKDDGTGAKNPNWDFDTNKTNPYENDSSSRKEKGILMDNITEFNISVLYNGTPPSREEIIRLPNSIQVTIRVLDDNSAARQQYKKASEDDKKLIAKEFRRIIFLERNQRFAPSQI